MLSKDFGKKIDIIQLRGSVAYREKICKKIYQDTNLKNQIFKMVLDNNGSPEEAEDIFQESIATFFKKAVFDREFTLKESAQGYIYGTARNLFYGSKRKELKLSELKESAMKDQHDDQAFSYDHIEITKKILTFTTTTCRQVLMYWAANCSMREIATLMKYKSEVMARKKKHECIQKLIRFFEQNPALADKILGHD
jgi:DNA-directed RNA polymerase specialized sigma24 family protein